MTDKPDPIEAIQQAQQAFEAAYSKPPGANDAPSVKMLRIAALADSLMGLIATMKVPVEAAAKRGDTSNDAAMMANELFAFVQHVAELNRRALRAANLSKGGIVVPGPGLRVV